MSYAPASLKALGGYWTARDGVMLGIVGDVGHTVGYHLGRDRIYSPAGRGADDYSVKLARDRAGLTDAAAAIDFGRLEGSLSNLYRFSRWFVATCQSGAPGSKDVREVIYSPDGVKVQRYSGQDGQIHTGAGNGDASHITHTHVSYYRDAENRDKIALIRPYFEGDDMAALKWTPTEAGEGIGLVTVKAGRGLVVLRTGGVRDPLHDTRRSFGRILLAEVFPPAAPGRQAGYLVELNGEGAIALDDVVETFVPDEPPAPVPTRRYVITADADPATFSVTVGGVPIE